MTVTFASHKTLLSRHSKKRGEVRLNLQLGAHAIQARQISRTHGATERHKQGRTKWAATTTQRALTFPESVGNGCPYKSRTGAHSQLIRKEGGGASVLGSPGAFCTQPKQAPRTCSVCCKNVQRTRGWLPSHKTNNPMLLILLHPQCLINKAASNTKAGNQNAK
jgi:hypothetical protein